MVDIEIDPFGRHDVIMKQLMKHFLSYQLREILMIIM